MHRIVAVDDGGVGYLTKGDNNARDDEWVYAAAGLGRLRREHIVGRQDPANRSNINDFDLFSTKRSKITNKMIKDHDS